MPINPIFHEVPSEGALPLPKSKGEVKGRIHLFEYKGEPGKDPYAVAGKNLGENPPKLGLFGKKFYVLHSVKNGDSVTWYKINKNSLKKRLNIQDNELKGTLDRKTGKTSAEFVNLIRDKHEKLEKLKKTIDLRPYAPSADGKYPGVGAYKTLEQLSERLIEGCVQENVDFPYKKVLFLYVNRQCPGLFHPEGFYKKKYYVGESEDDDPGNLKNYKKNEILLIVFDYTGLQGIKQPNGMDSYQPAENEPREYTEFLRAQSPFKVVRLDLKSSLHLLKTGELSEKVKSQL